MALVSMDVSEAEAAPAYNCCPTIYLTEDQVEALGLKANPPAAGASVGLRAIARVISKSENADLDGDGDGIDVCITLQITDLEVTPGAMSSSSAAGALYGNS